MNHQKKIYLILLEFPLICISALVPYLKSFYHLRHEIGPFSCVKVREQFRILMDERSKGNFVYISNNFDFQLRCVRLEMPNPLSGSRT